MREKMTKEELIKLVTQICEADFNTEKERRAMIQKFRQNVLDPEAVDLIYYHKPSLTPKEVVEKALAYKPIILQPPDDLNVS